MITGDMAALWHSKSPSTVIPRENNAAQGSDRKKKRPVQRVITNILRGASFKMFRTALGSNQTPVWLYKGKLSHIPYICLKLE